MKQKVVAILSVLKPVDDTRNFEKIASSISNTNKYDTNIIGFSAKNLPQSKNITFHPLPKFSRLSIRRALVQFTIAFKLLKLKPKLIIATCAELLPLIALHKIIFGCKIIYDVQENYYRNIIYTETYPAIFRYPIGLTVRMIECLSAPFINRFFLAERIYASQLYFTRSRYDIVENKAVIPKSIKLSSRKQTKKMVFVYSGTIATHYGIFEAIRFIKKLHDTDKNIELRIIGYAPDKRVLERLEEVVNQYAYIKLVGGHNLVSHNQILKEISTSDFCLLPYHNNKGTEGRIPTKLYECLAMETPVVISPNPAWDQIILENNAGIIYDFTQHDLPQTSLFHQRFYENHLAQNYLWNEEGQVIIKTVSNLV